MSQIALTDAERRTRLGRLGYSLREADFLVKAALHGGFFLRRQYSEFAGCRPGWADEALIQKVLANGHGTVATACSRTAIYHLSARPFYAALGQEDNRNRRKRPPVSIKNRIMGLDYVLDHPQLTFLPTEQEKLAYFTGTLKLDLADLPAKPFRSPRSRDTTSRFFVDKYPVFLGGAPTHPQVSFCFVDEGLATISHFETYLRAYRRLWSRLASFEVVYVAASDYLFEAAKRAFERLVSSAPGSLLDGSGSAAFQSLVHYFERRRLYDSGRHESFDRAAFIRLRNDRQRFSGRFFETLYTCWQAGDTAAIERQLAAAGADVGPLRGSLSMHLLAHNYDPFGTASKSGARKS